jgi:regulator of protease activity HflC (stomatin/prohibitin superfamily)
MESAFGWLGEIFNALLSLVPQIVLCRATHAGVKFQAGRTVRLLRPDNGVPFPCIKWWKSFPYLWFQRTGVHVYWPLVTETEIVPVKRQTTNLVNQYLCTSDGSTIGVGGIIVYEVSDVEKLLTECYDYEDTIQDLALAAIKKVVTSHSITDLQKGNGKVDKELTLELRKDLSRFGVRTVRVTLSDLAPCRMVGHWGSVVSVENNQGAT